jgi:hypothetical protein
LLVIGFAPEAEPIEINVTQGTVSGRIFEATSRAGIGGLIVKLTPSRAANRPQKITQKITTTEPDGRFEFTNLDKGRYLLEVYQGLTLLYRDVIDTGQETHKELSFTPRP